jgi:hypothetical protein
MRTGRARFASAAVATSGRRGIPGAMGELDEYESKRDFSRLLIKRRDEGADARRRPVSTQRESVLSGRKVDEVGD